MGQHYLALAGTLYDFFTMRDSLSLIAVANLSDNSGVLYPYYQVYINQELKLLFAMAFFLGKEHGEYTFPRTSASNAGFSLLNPFTMEVSNWGNAEIMALTLRLELHL